MFAITAAAALTLSPPTSAAPAPDVALGAHAAPAARGAGLTCKSAVTGVNADRHLRYDEFVNNELVSSKRSADALPFDVTAWGFYNYSGTARNSTLRLNVVSSDGTPRRVTIERNRKAVGIGRVTKYQQDRFTPRLFADGYTFYAYTLNGATMRRWSLTRRSDGSISYTNPVRVARGLRELTSLQATTVRKVRGVPSELLYGTTTAGELLQFVVPLERPGQMRTRTLTTTGLQGVTELSWSICNGDYDYPSFIAIDPVGNRAAWVTVKNATTRPKATIRGDVIGVADWNVTAAY